MMFRGLICVLLVRRFVGLGVDDTEKRRSEEILRAVSAAATADYEGLQQMKLQKSQTVTRLESAVNTRRCVTKLIEALNKEEATLSKQGDTMRGEADAASEQVDEEKEALQEAIKVAIQEVYGEVEKRYKRLKSHAGAMMDALKKEVENRTSVIDGQNTPEQLFQAIMENAAVQLNAQVYTHHHLPKYATSQLGWDTLTKEQQETRKGQHDFGYNTRLTTALEPIINCPSGCSPIQPFDCSQADNPDECDPRGVEGWENCRRAVEEYVSGLGLRLEDQCDRSQPNFTGCVSWHNKATDCNQAPGCWLEGGIGHYENIVSNVWKYKYNNEGEITGKKQLIMTPEFAGFNTCDADDVTSVQIMERVLCSCRDDDVEDVRTGLDPALVQQHLAEMMLHEAVVDAYARNGTEGIKEDSYDYINMENLLLMAGASQTSDSVNVDDKSSYTGRSFNPDGTTRGDDWKEDVNSSNLKDKDDLLVDMFNMKMTNLEKENLMKLEKQFVDWTIAKSDFHNVSVQKSAVDSALDMVKGKIGALETSLKSIEIYDLELLSLEDDEMRRIADIKEEFESLAADWLQLATYHCCDIIQGNTVECADATKHLMDPINNVFPGALKAPDPGRDCVRRLL